MYRIEKYNSSYYTQWNAFVKDSKNGTFLFHRDFMEYHADRFEDHSLLVFEGDKLLALLPANRVGNEVHSHDGLTYGGVVYGSKIKLAQVIKMLQTVLKYLHSMDIGVLKIKQMPVFYDKQYLDWENVVCNSKSIMPEKGFVIDYTTQMTISAKKKNRFRASKSSLNITSDNNFTLFWDDVLKPRLAEKYNALPVHTTEEINYLHSKFPDNILQYNVCYEGSIVAGITIFDFGDVVKSQYGATTTAGEKLRALDYAYITLIEKYKGEKRYFDLGTVKPDNLGLAKQKEELGGTEYRQDFYMIETGNYTLLEDVLI